jgi:hypothetical protein
MSRYPTVQKCTIVINYSTSSTEVCSDTSDNVQIMFIIIINRRTLEKLYTH